MNENRFASQRTHTRVKFRPLSTSCQLACITPMSPCTQSVNTLGETPEYEPDRSLTPTVLFPDVRANDPDGIFTHGPANAHLSLDTIEWLVDDKPIAEQWTKGTDYEIDTTESDLRGALKVKKNLLATEKAVLRFKAKFLDWRTGVAYYVESNDMSLTCTDNGADNIVCSVDKPTFTYDPILDGLLLYDYKKARGIEVHGTRDSYVDGKCYEQTINVLLTIGTTQAVSLPQGITMSVVRLGQSTALVPNSEATPELLQASYPVIKFDMRMIASGEYEVQFIRDGKVITSATIGLHTECTMPSSGQGVIGSDISVSQKIWNNYALLNTKNQTVEYPELFYLLKWFTQAQYNDNGIWRYAAQKEWQRGKCVSVPIKEIGIGITKNDSFFDYWFEADEHGARELCTDESSNVLTDENGEYLID